MENYETFFKRVIGECESVVRGLPNRNQSQLQSIVEDLGKLIEMETQMLAAEKLKDAEASNQEKQSAVDGKL